MQAFTVYAVCTVHTLFYGFGIDGLGEAVADYTSYTVFHGFVAQRLGFGFGQSENNEKPYIRYKRYKPFKASTVYAVIWFFYSLGIDGLGEAFADYTALSALYCVILFGIDGLGKLLPTIRLCMVCCFNGFSWFCGSEAGI